MKLRFSVVAAVLLIVAMLLPVAMPAQAAVPAPASQFDQGTPSTEAAPSTTLIISAFSYQAKDGRWLGESGPFFNAMAAGKTDVSKDLPACQKAFQGTIYGQPVLAVTMGTGKVATAVCMMQILQVYGKSIKEVVWSGIAGVSPSFSGSKMAIGDVCIGSIVVDWDLQFSDLAEGGGWWLSDPLPTHQVGSQALANELYQASKQVNWPEVPKGPTDNTAKYGNPVRKAKAFPPTTCAEITGDNFWHGAKEDLRARLMVSTVMSNTFGAPVKPEDIFVETAMEGTGWSTAMAVYAKATGTVIPWADSRSASNFDQPWQDANGKLAVTAQESINSGMTSGGGADYGSITAALPVLELLRSRYEVSRKLDPTPVIAVESAFDAELQLLLEKTTDKVPHVINGCTFTRGRLQDKDVVLFLTCGSSMYNSALFTQMVFDNFNVTKVLFSGIAGGVNPDLNIGDVVIGLQSTEYMEMLAARQNSDGTYAPPSWFQPTKPNFLFLYPQCTNVVHAGGTPDKAESVCAFPADPAMVAAAQRAAANVTLDKCGKDSSGKDVCLNQQPKIVTGNLVMGPLYMDNAKFREYVWNTWNASALAMEELGHACYVNAKPCLMLRSLSDLAGGGPGENEINTFFLIAANNSARLVLEIVKDLN